MARWHLTSDPDDHARLVSMAETAGLSTSGATGGSSHHVAAYEKRAIDASNFRALADGWICSAGTVLAGGVLGGDALELVHTLVRERGVHDARQQILGHYAIAVRHGQTIDIFTDEQGSISLYYRIDGPRFAISNSLQFVGACLDDPRIEPIELVAHALQKMSSGPDTFLSGVRRLFGSQTIRIDVATGSCVVGDVPNRMRRLDPEPSSMDDAVERYTGLVRETFSQFHAADSVAVNTTGGIDTRTVLAATLDSGITPLLMYGQGNSRLTNTKTPDMKVAQQLGELTGLGLYTMDWSGSQPHSPERMTALFERYGFLFSLFAGSDGLLREMEGGITPYPQLHLGGYTPAFTNKKPWELQRERYVIDDVVNSFMESRHELLAPDAIESYRQHIQRSVRAALAHAPEPFPEAGTTRDVFTFARLFVHLRRVSRAANFFNEFAYYLSPFMLKRLCDPLLTIPLEFRDRDEFQVRLIDALRPELLDVHSYSNMMRHEFDRESFTMRRVEPPIAKLPGRIRARVGHLLPSALKGTLKRTLASTPLRRLLLMSADDVKDLSINDEVRRSVTRDVLDDGRLGGIVDDNAARDLDLRSLHDMHVYLSGARQLHPRRASTAA